MTPKTLSLYSPPKTTILADPCPSLWETQPVQPSSPGSAYSYLSPTPFGMAWPAHSLSTILTAPLTTTHLLPAPTPKHPRFPPLTRTPTLASPHPHMHRVCYNISSS